MTRDADVSSLGTLGDPRSINSRTRDAMNHSTKTCQTADAISIAKTRRIEKKTRDAGQNSRVFPWPRRISGDASARPTPDQKRWIAGSTFPCATGSRYRHRPLRLLRAIKLAQAISPRERARCWYTGVALNHAIMAPITINHARNMTGEMQCLKDRSVALFCFIEHL